MTHQVPDLRITPSRRQLRNAQTVGRKAPRHSRADEAHVVRVDEAHAVRVHHARPVRARPQRASRAKRLAAVVTSVGVMALVAVTAVTMTTPASALDGLDRGIPPTADLLTLAAGATGDAAQDAMYTGDQRFVAAGAPGTPGIAVLSRGGYAAATIAPPPVVAAPVRQTTFSGNVGTLLQPYQGGGDNAFTDTGYNPNGWGVNGPTPPGFSMVSNKWFVNDPGGAIQWPFAVGCPISWGFGWRPGEFHEGVDFTPGAGAPIQAIAAGTVRLASNSYYGYGVTVIIDHMIGGQLVSSLYAHLSYGSMRVSAGEHVSVGQVIGQVGTTGDTFGANMHFEILANGNTPINPIPWLRSHAGP